MKRSTDRILTTHVGSLVRTKEIIEGMKALTMKLPYDEAKLAEDIRHGVFEVVKRQIDIGIDIPSDGEFGRHGYSTYINSRIEGLEPRPLDPGENIWGERPEAEIFPDFYQQYDRQYRTMWMHPEVNLDDMENLPSHHERFRVTAPVRYRGHQAIQEEIRNFSDALKGLNAVDAFIPAIQPAIRGHDHNWQEFYSSEEAYIYALADALHEEYKAITDAGFLVQVDYSSVHIPPRLRRKSVSEDDIRRGAEVGVDVVNHALKGIPEEMVRFHHCWGSMNVPHTLDTPLKDIVHLMLRVNAQAYSFEASNARHEHEWMIWKDIKLPEGKIIIPGVVTHQTNVVEHPDLVAWRIGLFAECVGRENVIAGTDCGFSQVWDAIRVHPSVQWAKLESLVKGAQIASKKLW